MNKLQETLDGLYPEDLDMAIQEILEALYDREVKEVLVRINDPRAYSRELSNQRALEVTTRILKSELERRRVN